MLTDIEGIEVNYERTGKGAPVLLLHGWGASIETMRPISDCLIKLGRETIALDFPGFGRSPEPKEAWGVPEYARFTRAFMTKLGITGCDVVCHSFGGRVVIYLASLDNALFNRLVMIDAAGIRPRRTLKYYIKTYAYKLGKRLSRIRLFDRLLGLSEKQKNAGSAEYRALTGVMRDVFVKTVNLDLTDRLSAISNEALLIWGSEDTDTPLYMGELMEKRMQNAGLAVIKGAGHFSYIDDYARFCAMMKILFENKESVN